MVELSKTEDGTATPSAGAPEIPRATARTATATAETATGTTMPTSTYTGASIRVLEGIEAIRLRPGMYIGDTDARGLHHLVYEVVDNSIDEAMAGYCRNIHVTIHADGSISVADDGRGIPVDIHAESGHERAGGRLDQGPRRGQVRPRLLQGLGRPARRRRDGRQRAVGVARGRGPPRRPGLAPGLREGRAAGARSASPGPAKTTGTKIRFLPDAAIFPRIEFDYDILEKRLRELAYLNKGIAIRLTDERGDEPKDGVLLDRRAWASLSRI